MSKENSPEIYMSTSALSLNRALFNLMYWRQGFTTLVDLGTVLRDLDSAKMYIQIARDTLEKEYQNLKPEKTNE